MDQSQKYSKERKKSKPETSDDDDSAAYRYNSNSIKYKPLQNNLSEACNKLYKDQLGIADGQNSETDEVELIYRKHETQKAKMKIIQNLNQKQKLPEKPPSAEAHSKFLRQSPLPDTNQDQFGSETTDLDIDGIPDPPPKNHSGVSKKLFKDHRGDHKRISPRSKHHSRNRPDNTTVLVDKDRGASIVRETSDPIVPKKNYNLKEKTDLIKLKDKIDRR